MKKCILCKKEIIFSLIQRHQYFFCYDCFQKNIKIVNNEKDNIYRLYQITSQKIVNTLIQEILENDSNLQILINILLHYINIKNRKYYTFNMFKEKYELNQVLSYLLNSRNKRKFYQQPVIILFSNQPVDLYQKCYPKHKIIIVF